MSVLKYIVLLVAIAPHFIFSSNGSPPYEDMSILSSAAVCICMSAFLVLAQKSTFSSLKIAAVLLWVSISLVSLAQSLYFSYFESYFGLEQFQQIGFAQDGLKSVNLSDIIVAASGYFISVLAAVAFLFFGSVKSLWPLGTSITLFVFGAFGISLVNNKLVVYQDMHVFVRTPSFVHPIHALFVTPFIGNQNSKIEEQAIKLFKRESVAEYSGTENLKEGMNVLLVVMESISAQVVGAYNPEVSNTPNIDSFAKNDANYVFRNFYAVSNFTVKGETALLCGLMDGFGYSTVSESGKEIRDFECLPHILGRQGYSSLYMHGNRSEFYNRKMFIPHLGFDSTYLFGDEPKSVRDSKQKIGWGISDRDMLDLSLDKLVALDQPFFAEVLTLSSHYDFKWDWGIDVPNKASATEPLTTFQRYSNAVYYTDYAFGVFWEKFKSSELYENTMLIVTADHGVNVYPPKKLNPVEENDYFFRLPLLIYHPAVSGQKEFTQIGSQLDVPPTILELLGVPEPDLFVGKSLLGTVDNPWALMQKSGHLRVRIDDELCYLPTRQFGERRSKQSIFGGGVFSVVDTTVQCDNVSGDVFGPHKVIRQRSVPYEGSAVEFATGLISLFHKNIFVVEGEQ